MLKSGGGSLASGLLSALATKIIATMLGPASVALLQTLQQTRQAAVAAATLNGQTALIQGASALAARRDYLQTAIGLITVATLVVAGIFVFAPAALAQWSGLPVGLVAWLAIPIVLSSLFTVLTALLNVLGEIGKLALLQVAGPAAMAATAWPVALAVRAGRSAALVHALTFAAAVSLAGALWGSQSWLRAGLRTGFWGRGTEKETRLESRLAGLGARPTSSTVHFFTISGAMLATSLLTSVVLLAIRARISRVQGLASTGHFDAAWTISMNHVTLVLASLQTYYLPMLARSRQEDRAHRIASVLTMATLAATPIIITIALFKPLVLGIFYSPAFHPAAAYLRWTLLGDYFKVGSWVLSVPLLAAAEMRAFLTADTAALAAFAASAWLISLVRTAAESAAMAFTLCYMMHFAVCYGFVRRRYGFRLGRVWPAGLVLVVAVTFI